jgi:hypothetical protein
MTSDAIISLIITAVILLAIIYLSSSYDDWDEG